MFGNNFNPIRKNIERNIKSGAYHKNVSVDGMKRPMEGLPRVVYYAADSGGCAFYRLLWPQSYLLSYNVEAVMVLYQMVMTSSFYKGIDAVVLQRQCTEPQVKFIEGLRQLSQRMKQEGDKGFRIIFEVDDIIAPRQAIPDYNKCKEAFDTDEITQNMFKVFSLIDEMTVPSITMRNHYASFFNFNRISVIPNYLPPMIFDRYYDLDERINLYRSNKDRPRILYAGSGTHFDVGNKTGQRDDFHHVVNQIIANKDKYKWVFLGGYPMALHPYIQSGEMEFHGWVPLFELPKKMKELGVQLAYAPLANNIFNASKANIKITESGALGIPLIAQNIPCYSEALLKFDSGEDLLHQMGNVLSSEEIYLEYCKKSREYSEQYFLDKHLEEYKIIHTTPYGHPSRQNNKFYSKYNQLS